MEEIKHGRPRRQNEISISSFFSLLFLSFLFKWWRWTDEQITLTDCSRKHHVVVLLFGADFFLCKLCQREIDNYIYLPLHCHDAIWKRQQQQQMRNLKSFSLFVVFFALACDRILMKTHNIENRCVVGPENRLFVGASVHLSARTFYRLGQWRG